MKQKNKKNEIKLKECVVKLIRLKKTELMELLSERPKTYNLRARPKNVAKLKQNAKQNSLTSQNVKKQVEIPNCLALVKPTSMQMTKLWNAKKRCGIVPEVGSIVLAKMRSYRPWPAIILNENGRSVFWVRFLGKGSHGSVKKTECVPFENALECVQQSLENPVEDYSRAVREAEVILHIPSEKSLLKNI